MDNLDLSLTKMPPQNLEAEMAVLGSMLIEETAISYAMEILDGFSFYNDSHRRIFESMVKLYSENKAVDIVTLIEELKKTGDLDKVGGPTYITNLTTVVPTAANVMHYAAIVKEKSILRNLISAATNIISESYESHGEVAKILDKAERIIFDISSKKVESSFVPLKEIIKGSIETIDQLYQKKAHVTGIPTGFSDFDSITAGLHPSDLIIFAGRPSMGKSALVSSIAEHVGVAEKMPLVIFSLEMSKEQFVQRMLCSHARVNAHNVRTGFLSQTDWPKLTNAAGKLSDAPIYIDDTAGLSVLELRAKARRLKSQRNIQLIIVDYLQLMQGMPGSENRQQEISEISRSLKALARELSVPVIAVSQLSRAVESRQDRRPQLSDLRESGAIEQDADLVGLLLREEYYNPTEENRGIAEVIIAKQRNGPVGSIKLVFIKDYVKFDNLASKEERLASEEVF
ncbi:MAG: replicative DNA helicase [Candidatus Omnitrophica bacterium CG12_big_fil_rev_8_21_14_0_65_42_8]|nr:MAG: replicative DNA helicase [Candidatus Omnitrophica bacterium CG12_big_fil_rev_8_21_14_0_65_42_8]